MKQLIRNNLFFFCPYIIFLLICILFMMLYSKATIHVFLNSFHSPFFDTFFRIITYFGNGIMYVFVFVYLLTRKCKLTNAFIFAVIASVIVVYVLKHVLFPDMYRPVKYFEMYGSHKLYLVEGIKLHYMNSFPSGHATTAFTVFFTLAVVTKKNGLKPLFFVFALLTGYSRVYLSQHFLMDVVAGSILGVGFVTLALHTLIKASDRNPKSHWNITLKKSYKLKSLWNIARKNYSDQNSTGILPEKLFE